MFTCHRCNVDARDGVQCTSCLNRFDFPCAGITEAGYRKLGDRKATWKCSACKAALASLFTDKSEQGKAVSYSGNLDNIHHELKKLAKQMASLPQLITNVKSIQADLADLKNMKNEISDVKNSLEHVHISVDELNKKVTEIDR